MTRTIRERLIEGLTTIGATPAVSRSTKYDVFSYQNVTYYVGKAGALRASMNGTVASSFSVENRRAAILKRVPN